MGKLMITLALAGLLAGCSAAGDTPLKADTQPIGGGPLRAQMAPAPDAAPLKSDMVPAGDTPLKSDMVPAGGLTGYAAPQP